MVPIMDIQTNTTRSEFMTFGTCRKCKERPAYRRPLYLCRECSNELFFIEDLDARKKWLEGV